MQEAVRVRGPLVWRDMDQNALDDAYDQAVYAPNRDQVIKRRLVASEQARQLLGEPQRAAYGPTAIEALDIFRTAAAAPAPVNIFVHGGAWNRNRAADYSAQAELFVRAGAHHVILDFCNVSDVGGDLAPMVDQIRRAVAWVYRNAASFTGDPNRLYLSGHSSGAHLAGCVVTTDWTAFGLPTNVLKGALLVSGMYDLEPVALSKRSGYVNFTDTIVAELSAMRHIDRIETPLVLAHGTCETPEFQRQTRDFHAAVTAAGKRAELLVADGYNHFEIIETLASPYGLLGRAVLKQMNFAQ
jgi:arylformamidase